MTSDDIKLISVIIGVLGFAFGLYQYWKSRPRFQFRMFKSSEPNVDECGTYLCAQLYISNVGGKSGLFGGFIAVDDKGEEYYPISTFKIDQEIKPEATISGIIPIGHIISYPPNKLFMQDGVFRKHKIPTKMLKNTINELKLEKKRYEDHGWAIHPTQHIKSVLAP